MRRYFSAVLALAAAAVLAVGGLMNGASAQGAGPINQMKLTDKHITGFIAAQKDLVPLSDELQKAAESGNITPALQGKLDAVAKKNGFKSLSELDDVTDNINMIMAGLDPQSGEFKMNAEEMRKAIREEIEEIKKDTSIPANEKKELLAEQEKALAQAGKLEFPGNVALVKKYMKQIEDALQQ
ncbi:MAG: hypothetical protein R3D27_11955 [Hyphomicrobiaceae bacterium]